MTHKKLSYRMGTFLSLVLVVLAVYSFFNIYRRNGEFVEYIVYIAMIVIGIFFIVTSRFPVGRYVQIIGLCLTSIGTVLTDINLDYFVLQVVIIYLLAEKYGFWKRNIFAKTTVSFVLIIVLLVLSYIVIERTLHAMLISLVFYMIFLTSFSLIKLDDMRDYFENIKKLKSEISDLSLELVEKDKLLESLEPDYIDPVTSGLTKAELKLLENLCMYRESNQELSERLGKSENTIKTQLKSIMQKIGVDNRHQLIEACKEYFYALKI